MLGAVGCGAPADTTSRAELEYRMPSTPVGEAMTVPPMPTFTVAVEEAHVLRDTPVVSRDGTAAQAQSVTDDMDTLLTEAGWPQELHEQAKAIINCESRGRPDVISATGDYGLFQINALTWEPYFGVQAAAFLDPKTNAQDALVIYQRGGGWSPWTCRP